MHDGAMGAALCALVRERDFSEAHVLGKMITIFSRAFGREKFRVNNL